MTNRPHRNAPPPPINNPQNRAFTLSANSSVIQQSRYAPMTNWMDQTNNDAPTFAQMSKKQAPPRPPPPKTMPGNTCKIQPNTSKKTNTFPSNSILSNLVSRTRLGGNKSKVTSKLPAPRPPPPPSTTTIKPSTSFTSSALSTPSYGEKQLISFDSPPSSPTFTQKSNSDCVSVDSFSSDSNYSPNNGFSTESGFEDDFVLDNFKPYKRMTPVDPFEILDEPLNQTNVRPVIAQKPTNIGNALFYTSSNTQSSSTDTADETLCNGKNLITKSSIRTGPTIIRAVTKKTQAPKPKSIETMTEFVKSNSPPMPSIAPPPPPKEYFEEVVEENAMFNGDDDGQHESYAIALYDFVGEQDNDLSFKEGEKVYLIQQLNDEWLFGRNKRGCEGMFPTNFVEIKIPIINDTLKNEESAPKQIVARALYDFHAETNEDLTLKVNDEVIVLHTINEEWLYGRIGNQQGQFPANYVEYL